jgi:uncharacterized protein YjiS (DUF1127 family)
MSPQLRKGLDEFFAAVGQGFNAYIEKRARVSQMAELDSKSDEELAKMGLRRDEIPRYVFRDLIGL